MPLYVLNALEPYEMWIHAGKMTEDSLSMQMCEKHQELLAALEAEEIFMMLGGSA